MRWFALGAVVLVCACKKERAAPPAPVAAPVATAAGAPDAGAPPPGVHFWLDFSLVATFSEGVDPHVFILDNGIAIVSDNEVVRRRNLVTLTDFAGSTPMLRAGPMPLTLGDPVRFVAGTTKDFWFGTERAPSSRVTLGRAVRLPHRHRIVGEIEPGRWLGLESHAQTNGIDEEQPQAFELLAGEGEVPPLKPEERVHDLAFLGDGRLCGVAMIDGVQSVWWREGASTGSQAVPPGYYPGLSRVFRGPGGECMLALAPWERHSTTVLYPVRTGLYGTPIEVPTSLWDNASFARDGSIWTRSNPGVKVTRRNVLGDRVVEQSYELPSERGGHPITGMLSIAARSEEDVWVVAWSEAERRSLLLRSKSAFAFSLFQRQPPDPVHAWPAP